MSDKEQNNISNEAAYTINIYQAKLQKLLNQMIENAHKNRYIADQRKLNNISDRLDTAFSYFDNKLVEIFDWLFNSGETSNFTYPITELNKEYLASFCAVITGKEIKQLRYYIEEILNDSEIYNHVRSYLSIAEQEGLPIDPNFNFGRRLGWYIIARALKPKVIVETGVSQGIGSVLLATALMRNSQEGYPGYYYGTDINPKAGFLFNGQYRNFGKILYGDSIESLKILNLDIDLFINDSDHSAEYEMQEYITILPRLKKHSIILGDNSHITNKLCEFASNTGRKFLFFQEKPVNHWYPGAGIGVAF